MSPPDTNLETQARQHRPALRGMWLGLGFVGILFAAFVAWIIVTGEEPEGAETQVVPGVGTEPAD